MSSSKPTEPVPYARLAHDTVFNVMQELAFSTLAELLGKPPEAQAQDPAIVSVLKLAALAKTCAWLKTVESPLLDGDELLADTKRSLDLVKAGKQQEAMDLLFGKTR